MRLEIVEGDITEQRVDAIVNAANEALLPGGGVAGAIHRKGGPEIYRECLAVLAGRDSPYLPTGEAVATGAGNLPARWVIHTVGPVYDEHTDQTGLLRRCYASSLAVADGLGAASVAFPLISAGVYGWPVDDAVAQALAALRVAGTAVAAVAEVRLVLFGADTFASARRVIAAG